MGRLRFNRIGYLQALIISAVCVFLFASTASIANADNDAQRPNPSRYNTPMTQAPEEVPSGWTCSQQGHNVSNFYCTNSQNPDQWFQRECVFFPAGEFGGTTECSACSGTGPTGRCVPFTAYRDLGLGGLHTETAHVDNNGDVSVTQEDHSVLEGIADWMLGVSLAFVATIIWFFTEIFVWIMTGLLGIVGFLFDWVVNEFVVGMGKYITATNATAVREAWTLIRDLCNIGIIGGLIAIGIGTIIGSERYSIQKSLARLLVAALLINFSYFFAGAVIDASNFVARAAYNSVIHTPGCEGNGWGCGPASRFLRVIDLAHFRDQSATNNTAITQSVDTRDTSGSIDTEDKFSASRDALFNILMIVFMGMTIFVFLSAISLLIARFLALIFILITSPVGIAGAVVPGLKKYADDWWKALWSQTIFAPVYFLLVGISLNILDQFEGTLRAGTVGIELSAQISSLIGTAAMFVVAIGFMLTALTVAKKMSEEASQFKDLYSGVQKYLTKPVAGMFSRETLGRAAFWAGQRYPEVANRIQQWSKQPGIIQGTGRLIGKVPGVKGLTAAAARGADRLIQSRLDKTGDQKFFGLDGYKSIFDAKLKRKAQLEETKKDLENKDQDNGREAELELQKERKKLKKGEKGRKAEIARLEQLDKEGKLDADGRTKLDALRHDQEHLDKIEKLRKLRKQKEKDGVTTVHGALTEGEELNKLHKEKLALEGKGTLSDDEKKRLAEINDKIKEEEEFEKLKDEFKVGGAQGVERRARSRHERALEAGEKLEAVNEVERADALEARNGDLNKGEQLQLSDLEKQRAQNPEAFDNDPVAKKRLEELSGRAYLTQAQERAYVDALQTPESARTQEQKDALAAYGQGKMTSFEREERDYWRNKRAPLQDAERGKLENYRNKRNAGQLTDPAEIKDMVALEQREKATPFSAAEQSALTGLRLQQKNGTLTKEGKAMLAVMEEREKLIPTGGLSTQAKEGDLQFRSRQMQRDDGLGRAVTVDEETGELKVEDLSAYRYRTETSDKTGFRVARGERERIMGNFSSDFIKKEYEKNPKSIIQYATALTSDQWLKVAGDHAISEDVRNAMWTERMGFWGGGVVKIKEDLASGKLVKGSKEYDQRMLDMYNWVTRYVPNKEFVEALQQDAVIGEIKGPNGEPQHVRLKDLNGPEFRELTWNTSSSSAFADAKDAKVYGTNQTAEIARAKRTGVDTTRDLDAAMYMLQGLSDKEQFLTNVAGTVQYDAKARATKTVNKLLDSSQKTIDRFENPATRGDLTSADYASALRTKRIAQLHQETLRGNGPLDGVIGHVTNFDSTTGKNAEGKTRNDYKREVYAAGRGMNAENLSAAQITEAENIRDDDANLDTYMRVNAVARHKAGTLQNADGTVVGKNADQGLIYEYQDEVENAAPDWFKGKNDREAKAVLNKRNLHSTSTYKGVQPDQIPELLDKQDGSEVAKFWEGMLTYRNADEVMKIISNPRIGQTFQRPPPDVMQKINIVRMARGDAPIILDNRRSNDDDE